MIIFGQVRRLIRVSSRSLIIISHFVLSASTGRFKTCIHVLFSCKHLGHRSCDHYFCRFTTLPTGENPVHNFDIRFVFPQGHFLLTCAIWFHDIIIFCVEGKGCLSSYQYKIDSDLPYVSLYTSPVSKYDEISLCKDIVNGEC